MDDSPCDETLLALMVDATDDDATPPDSDEDIFPDEDIFSLDPAPAISLLQPLAKLNILLGKYEKPIPVIAFLDTGAAVSIINPTVLPRSYWQKCSRSFVNIKGFTGPLRSSGFN